MKMVYRILWRDFPILLVAALYVAVAALVAIHFDIQHHFRLLMYPAPVVEALLVSSGFYFVAATIVMMIRREPSPIGRMVVVVGAWVKNLPQVLGLFLTLVAIVLFLSAFTSIKSMIPLIRPYELDPLLAGIDHALHGRVDPWRITHGLFSSAAATAVINLFYNLWFFLLWGVFLSFMLRVKKPRERLHYLLAQLMSWSVLGSVAAVYLSSAGPCYYGNLIAGENPFAPLMGLLNAQHETLVAWDSPVTVWALGVQDMLWERYADTETVLGGGISAMPSMHVASTVIMALGLMRIRPWLGVLGWLLVAVIQIGSVHLAWHYAIDGYVSIVVALLLWKLSGWISTWWFEQTRRDRPCSESVPSPSLSSVAVQPFPSRRAATLEPQGGLAKRNPTSARCAGLRRTCGIVHEIQIVPSAPDPTYSVGRSRALQLRNSTTRFAP